MHADGVHAVLHCCLDCLQEDQVRKVGLSRYSRVSRTAFGLNGKKRIAVLRAGGAILGEAGRTRHPTAPTAAWTVLLLVGCVEEVLSCAQLAVPAGCICPRCLCGCLCVRMGLLTLLVVRAECVWCCWAPVGAGKASGVGGSGSITPDAIIPKLRALSKDKNIAGGSRTCCCAVLACVLALGMRAVHLAAPLHTCLFVGWCVGKQCGCFTHFPGGHNVTHWCGLMTQPQLL